MNGLQYLLVRAFLGGLVLFAGALTGGLAKTKTTAPPPPSESSEDNQSEDALVEYFDPACGSSRNTHLLLSAQLDKGVDIKRELVLVSVARGIDPTIADRICASGSQAIMKLVGEFARFQNVIGLDAADPQLLGTCSRSVARATSRLALLQKGIPKVPAVQFRGTMYVGENGVSELARHLRAPIESVP
jgi:hypothetical protein